MGINPFSSKYEVHTKSQGFSHDVPARRTFIPRMVLVLTRSAAQHEIVGGSLWNEIVGVHYRGNVFFDSTVATRPAVSD